MKKRLFLIVLLVSLVIPISMVSAATMGGSSAALLQGKSTPTPAAQTQAGGTVLFEDDFSDPNSGWEVGNYTGGAVSYSNGAYLITSTQQSSFNWGLAGQNFSDVQVDVDATQLAGPANNNNGYGVMCRVQPESTDGYMMFVSGDGYASIYIVQGGSPAPLVEWAQAPAVIQGNSTNHLQAVCSGVNLQLYVNGELAAQTQDASFASGDIGFVVASLEVEPSEISFDNLIVTDAAGGSTTPVENPNGLSGTQTTALFSDDFSDPTSGWEVGNYNSGSVGYGNGDYVVTSTTQAATMWGVANQSFTDIDLEVDATQVSGPANNNNGYGVMCRVQPNGNGYLLRVSGDGFAGIHMAADDSITPLVDWTPATAITQGNASNHLRVVCSGSTLELYVNGELVASATDSTYTSGDIALLVSSYEVEPSEVHFDNLVVNGPGGAAQTSTGLSGIGTTTDNNTTTTTGEALLSDDFSDPNSGWEVGNYQGGQVGYANGTYVVESIVQNSFMWGVASQNFADVDLEVDITMAVGPTNNNTGYGVICREQGGTGDGYWFRISSDGYASIALNGNDSVIPLADWVQTPAIVQGAGVTNRVRAVCAGSTLQLYVNGELVAEASDTTYTQGDIAFAVASYEAERTVVNYDNLVVNAPAGVPQSAPAAGGSGSGKSGFTFGTTPREAQ